VSALVRHQHYGLVLERARQLVSGETAAGWWRWEYKTPVGKQGCHWMETEFPAFDSWVYRCTATDKHPDYESMNPKLKLELRLIDMSKLPPGSEVRVQYGEDDTPTRFKVLSAGAINLTILSHNLLRVEVWPKGYLRLMEQNEFTFWSGCACPVPEGVEVEAIVRAGTSSRFHGARSGYWHHGGNPDNNNIIGYRIIGAADGWTDDPEKAK